MALNGSLYALRTPICLYPYIDCPCDFLDGKSVQSFGLLWYIVVRFRGGVPSAGLFWALWALVPQDARNALKTSHH